MNWLLNTFNFSEKDFIAFSLEHFLIVLFFSALGFWLILFAQSAKNKTKNKIAFWITIVLILNIIFSQITGFLLGEFDIKTSLPLNLCNFCPFLLPFVLIKKKYWWYEILYFWIMVGTLQATLTPDLQYSLPHRMAIQYWVTHCGLVVAILYATVVFNFIPTWKSLIKSFIAINVFIGIISVVNKVTGGNYMFLSEKPEQETLLDFLGESYIFWGEFLAIGLMLIMFLPILYFYPQANTFKNKK